MVFWIYVQHQSIQGVPTIYVNESMPYGQDNADTLQPSIPSEHWDKSETNEKNLAQEDRRGAAKGLKGEVSVDSSGAGGDPTSTTQKPQHVHQEPLPEVPDYTAIVRRSQFQTKKDIKEEKDEKKAKKGGRKSKGKGKGKGRGKGKGKGKKCDTKTVKLRNSKRRQARKAKARRSAKAARAHEDHEDDNDEHVQQDEQAALAPIPAQSETNSKQKKSGQRKQRKSKGSQGKTSASDGGKDTSLKRRREPTESAEPAKVSKAKAKAKAKSKSKTSTKSPALVDSVVPTLKTLLKECFVPGHKCECDHHCYEVPDNCDENVQLSIYWTRPAVGVKIKESSLPQQVRKNKAVWQQIAYFGGGTCPYVNIALADHYVLPSSTWITCQKHIYMEKVICPYKHIYLYTSLIFLDPYALYMYPFHNPAPSSSGPGFAQAQRWSWPIVRRHDGFGSWLEVFCFPSLGWISSGDEKMTSHNIWSVYMS